MSLSLPSVFTPTHRSYQRLNDTKNATATATATATRRFPFYSVHMISRGQQI